MNQQSLMFGDGAVASEALVAARRHFARLEGGRLTGYPDFLAAICLATEPVVDYGMDVVAAAAHVRVEGLVGAIRVTPERKTELLLHAATVLIGQHAGRHSPGIEERVRGLMATAARGREVDQARGDLLASQVAHLMPAGTSLMAHQREALALIEKRNYRCVVHDDQGLGKTVQVLCSVLVRSQTHPVFPLLVVSPASVTGVWEEHAVKWLAALEPEVVPLVDVPEGDFKGRDLSRAVVVASYARMADRSGELAALGFQTTVFDESHYLAGKESRRSLAAILVRGRARDVLCATGTMEPNGRPIETWVQFRLVDPGSRDLSSKKFSYRYCGGRTVKMGSRQFYKDDGCSRPVEFGRLMDRYSFRRTKAELGDKLPAKIRYRFPVKLSIRQRLELAEIKDRVRAEMSDRAEEAVAAAAELPEGSRVRERAVEAAHALENTSALAEMGEMRRFVGLAKVDFVVGRVRELLDDGHRVILFTYHHEVHDALFEKLQEIKGKTILSGTAALTGKKRTELVERANREADVVVLSYAYCEGITLTAFDTVGIVERHWIPDKERQAEDRAHRIGQTKTVSVELYASPGTIDDFLDQLHGKKEDNSGQVVGSAARRAFREWILKEAA